MVVWLVGLSGAGKTTIARHLTQFISQSKPNTVLVDGDDIREVFKFNQTLDAYSVEGRRLNAERIVEICKWLDRQNINVICSILCIFHDILRSNRNQFSQYYEVSVQVPLEELFKRDIKDLYKAAMAGDRQNVVGVDIPWVSPPNPDLLIDNTGALVDCKELALSIARKVEFL